MIEVEQFLAMRRAEEAEAALAAERRVNANLIAALKKQPNPLSDRKEK
jgi:hypothetical protein